MIVSVGETYRLEKYDVKENTPFEFEETPSLIFYGKPANKMDKSKYRLLQGVEGNALSVYIICSNLPSSIKCGDRIKFMGNIMNVSSVGYYFENSQIVNVRAFSNDYIIKRCPKGIVLS